MKAINAIVLLASTAQAYIEVKGNAFYDSKTHERFYMRGVDYQPQGSSNLLDPLADKDLCTRDIQYFKELGLNTIRVYSVDNSANHDECMGELAKAGIYLILDVNTPKASINRKTPKPSYNAAYLQNVFATVDAFKGYDNLLGVFAGNEVINDEHTTGAAPYVKAVVRDLKAYIKAQSKRPIPVGYSAADISSNRWQQMAYFNCGQDSERVDMFGTNDYSFCGKSSYQQSGYAQKVEDYANYSVPLFMSEYGCNKVTPRVFDEVEALYSSDMTAVYSGGLVYEYTQEDSNYGLVSVGSDKKVTTLQDYKNLKDKFSSVKNPSGAGGAQTSSLPANDCPAYDKESWAVSGTIPPMPSAASAFLSRGAGKGLGSSMPDTQSGSDDSKIPAAGGSNNAQASGSSGSGSSKGGSSSSSSSSGKTSASPRLVPSICALGVLSLSMVVLAIA